MDEQKTMKILFFIVAALALLFLILSIIFIILYATKTDNCPILPTKPSNAFLISAVAPLNETEAERKINELFLFNGIPAHLFVSTKKSDKTYITAIAVLMDDAYKNVPAEEIMKQLTADQQQSSNNIFKKAIGESKALNSLSSLMDEAKKKGKDIVDTSVGLAQNLKENIDKEILQNKRIIREASQNVRIMRQAEILGFKSSNEEYEDLIIESVTGSGDSKQSFSRMCDPVEPEPEPSPSDFPEHCSAHLIIRDFILVVDLIPSEFDYHKLDSLKQFLLKFGIDLLVPFSKSQIMLIGYDSNGLLITFPFVSKINEYFINVDYFMSNSTLAHHGLYGRLSAPLEYIADNNIGLRAYTEAFIIVIADHIPADADTTLNSARLAIRRLERSGFYLSVITPIQGPTPHAVSDLIFNKKWLSDNKVKSYANLPNEGIKFAIQQACTYINIVPSFQHNAPLASIFSTSFKDISPTHTIESNHWHHLIPQKTIESFSGNNEQIVFDQNISTKAPITTTPIPKRMDCMDLLIILDRSQSINIDDYNKYIKNFVKELAKNIAFTPVDQTNPKFSRVGVVQYSDSADFDIKLQKRNFAEFIKLVDGMVNYTHLDGSQAGYTNTAAALSLAEDIFKNPAYMSAIDLYKGTTIILITDGRHSMYTKDPITVAERLRKSGTLVICVGVSGVNGDYSKLNRQELLGINGYQENLLFETIGSNLTSILAQRVIGSIYCEDDYTGSPRTLPPYYPKGSRPIIFAVETTEIVFSRIVSTLQATKLIAQYFGNLSNQSTFRLITYSNSTQSKIFGQLGDDYTIYANIIDNLTEKVDKQLPNLKPLFDGRTFLSEGIVRVEAVIEEYYSNGSTTDGSPIVIFFGQAEKGKLYDRDETLKNAYKIGRLTSYSYVGDLTAENLDTVIWPEITGIKSNVIPLNEFARDDINDVAFRMISAINDSWNEDISERFAIKKCPPDIGAMDVFVAIHQANDNKTQTLMNTFTNNVMSGFESDMDHFHTSVLLYGGSETILLSDLQRYDPTETKTLINGIRASEDSNENIQSPLKIIFDKYGYGNSSSPSGMRKFAKTTAVFITDTAEEMNLLDINEARTILDKWKKHDCSKSPMMVLIRIGNESLSTAAIELFGGERSVQKGQFDSWRNVDMNSQISVSAINAAIRNIYQQKQKCYECCNCETGLSTGYNCAVTASKASQFMRLLEGNKYINQLC